MTEITESTNPPQKKRRRWPVVSMAVLMAALMLSVAIVGPATQEAEALTMEEYAIDISRLLAEGKYLEATFAAGPGLLYSLVTGDTRSNRNAGVGATPADYSAMLRALIAQQFDSAKINIANNHIYQNATIADLSNAARWAAYDLFMNQKENNLTHTFDSEAVFTNSKVLPSLVNMSMLGYNYYNAIFKGLDTLPQQLTGTYDNMEYGSGFYYVQTPPAVSYAISSDAPFYNYLLPCIDLAAPTGYFFIDADKPAFIVARYDTASNVTFLNRAGETIKTIDYLAKSDGLLKFIPSQLGIPSGEYKLSGGSGAFAGSIFPSTSESATIKPCLIGYESATVDRDSAGEIPKYSIVKIYSATELCTWSNSHNFINSKWTAGKAFPGIIVKYTSVNKDSVISIEDIFKVVLPNTLTQSKAVLSAVNSDALAYYEWLKLQAEPIPPVIHPVADWQEILKQDLTPEQFLALYYALNKYLEGYYQSDNYGSEIPAWNASLASLKLLCRGPIYNAAGVMIHDENTVWSPFVSYKPWTISLGNNTAEQSGLYIIWGTADNLNASFAPSWHTMQAKYYDSGYTFDIIQMLYDKAPIDSYELEVNEFEFYDPSGVSPPPWPQPDDSEDSVWDYWYYMAMIIGAALLVIAILARNTPFAIIGIVVLAAGAVGYWYVEMFPEWWESVKPWVISQDFWRPGP